MTPAMTAAVKRAEGALVGLKLEKKVHDRAAHNIAQIIVYAARRQET